MGKLQAVVISAIAILAVGSLTGCGTVGEPKVQPKVAPPAIATAGTLRVGVDMSQPPFAGRDQGREAGFDIDVAAALADRLGLRVVYVDVKPSDAATALAAGTADAVMSVPLADAAAIAQLSLAGSYIDNGPGLFISTGSTASVEPSLTLDSVAGRVAAQEGSESFWILRSELDSESIAPYESLRAAIEALNAGEEELVAGDILTAAYIARDFPEIHFAGQLRPAQPLAVAVAAENTTLGEAIRSELDALAADGVIDALRRKWVGALPELQTAASEESGTVSSESTAAP